MFIGCVDRIYYIIGLLLPVSLIKSLDRTARQSMAARNKGSDRGHSSTPTKSRRMLMMLYSCEMEGVRGGRE